MSEVHEARIEAAAKLFYESQGGANYETSLYRENWYAIAKRALAAADAGVTVDQIERAIMGRTATAGAKAVQRLYRGETEAVQCDQHKPVQHRDGKPPWCRACGKTAANTAPDSRFSGEAGA